MNAKPPPDSSKSSLIWGVVIGAIVVVGIGAVVLAKSSSTEANNESDSRQVSEVTVTGAALAPFTDPSADAAVGTTIPTLAGTNFEGEEVIIGPDGTAKVILVVAHWCPHCQAEVPRVMEHLESTPMPDDVELVFLSTSVKEGSANYPPETWLENEGVTQPVLVDSAESVGAQTLALPSFPYTIAVKADGTVAARNSGEMTTDQFDQLVAAAQG